jgi:hypothetical protein
MIKTILVVPFMGACLLFTILGDRGACGTKGGAINKNPAQTNDRLAAGVWGGEHIRAEVTDRGAQIEFDCAHGTIDQAIVLNSKGGFDSPGKYTPQHGGPVRDDEESTGISVRYVGSVRDSELSLTITNPATKESLGDYRLTQGSEGRVMKCR